MKISQKFPDKLKSNVIFVPGKEVFYHLEHTTHSITKKVTSFLRKRELLNQKSNTRWPPSEPYTVHYWDGTKQIVQVIDGGGAFIGGDYEVHGTHLDGSFFCEPQKSIKKVTDNDGYLVPFGNPYYPGHSGIE